MKKNYQKPLQQQKKNSIKENSTIIPKKKNGSSFFIFIAFCVPLLLYLQTIRFGFTHLDDDSIITKNISFLSNIKNVPNAFLTDQFINKSTSFYRPLGTLSYMLDIQLSGGSNTWMFHLSNILLLGLISCLLFLLLKKFLIPPKLALIGTLVYCVHPLFVSTVAFIPNRAELLQALFSLLSFLFLIDFIKNKKIAYLFIHWIAFSLALFSKETAAMLPVLFILFYFIFSSEKRLEKKYLFILILYAVSGIFWFWLRSKAIGGIVSNQIDSVGLIPILKNLRTIPESLEKFFMLYGIAPIPGFSILKTLTGLGIIAVIIFLFFKNKVRLGKEKIFCFSWFLILMLPPMLYKHPLIEYFDHRFFLPLIGILLFLLFIFPKKWMKKGDIKISWLPIAVIVILSSFTILNSSVYSDPMTFYNSAISRNQGSAMAYNNRGTLKNDKNNFQGAIDDYDKAIEINQEFADAYNNRGSANNSLGNFQGALEDYNKAIALRPIYDQAYYNRGLAKNKLNDFKGAIEDYNKAISFKPNYEQAYCDRGLAKSNLKDIKGALEDYDKAIAINPNYAEAYTNKGVVQGSSANFKDALIYFNKAVEINSKYLDAYYNRALAKYFLKDYAGAIEDCDKVLKLNSNEERAVNLKTQAQQKMLK